MNSTMLSPSSYNMAAMYQYMVGNEDWDLANLRNIKVVQSFSADLENKLIVPYDFDFSGTVNAPYAIPNVELKHKTIKQRHFYGAFSNANELELISNHFLSKRKEILQSVRKFKVLNSDARYDIERYLEEFFLILKNKKHAADIFLEKGSIGANKGSFLR